jgi:hypothetical protein
MSYRSSRLAPLRGAALLALLAGGAFLACAGGLIALGSAQAATLPTLTLSINASSITVGGTLQSGGVNVVSTATGVKEADPTLFLLKPGVSVAELYAFLNTNEAAMDPNTADKYGTIVFDAEASPGASSEVQTTLQPGQYVALNAQGEKSAKWPRASFTVTTAAAPVALPTPQATVRSIEFGFRGPSTLHDGELVRFENEGFLVHMDVAVQVKSLKAAKQVVKDLLAGNEKKTQKLAIGGAGFAGPLSTGAYQQETITAKPGWYVQACFMDTQDGRNHTRLGMERIIKIAK